MKIFIGADHRGTSLRDEIITYLKSENIEVERSYIENNEVDDYPDFAFDIAKKVLETEDSLGILICGNGIGASIAANKVKRIRCARVINSDDAFAAKNHNGANVISIGALEFSQTKEIIDMFIATKPASDERHLRRIDKIIDYENGTYNEL